MENEDPAIAELRTQVVNLRDVELPALRTSLEGERDEARARVTELEGLHASATTELETARAEVQALKDAAARVPAPAAGRQTVDVSAMSASEKIAYGIAQGRK